MWNNAITYKSRLAYWKELRNGIKTDESYIAEISKIPYVLFHREVDYYTPSSWYTPWDILELKVLCRSCVGILVYHSIKIAIPDSKPEVLLVNNTEEQWLVVKYNGLIYNFLPGQSCTEANMLSLAKIESIIDTNEIKKC